MKCIIVGAGGIGSYFIMHLDKLIKNNQLNNWEFYVYDDDKIEYKNLLYQNFTDVDVGEYKVQAMEEEYTNIDNYIPKRVNLNELSQYDLIILCADNNKIRKETYQNYINNNIPFIDTRSNGSALGIYSSDTENYMDTIDDSEESYSCQYPFQLENNEVEQGNVIIASILSQALLNYVRKNELPYDKLLKF